MFVAQGRLPKEVVCFALPKFQWRGIRWSAFCSMGGKSLGSVMGFGCGVGLKWSIGPENSYSSLFLERSFGFWEEEVES